MTNKEKIESLENVVTQNALVISKLIRRVDEADHEIALLRSLQVDVLDLIQTNNERIYDIQKQTTHY